MRYLFVGDPHAEPHDLADCLALGRLVIRAARHHKARVLIAGDLYHTHAVIHADVQLFWWNFFEACHKAGVGCLVLKGNHDAPGTEGNRATALIAHAFHADLVLHEPLLEGGVLFCPYTSAEKLLEWSASEADAHTMVCHATFDGSHYESGTYASDGIDPNLVSQKMIISGHIHAPQEFGKVWYPGAPRWRTRADANVDRALWVLDFDGAGKLVGRIPVSTGVECRRILQLTDTPEAPLDPTQTWEDKDRVYVDARGPQTWLDERRPLWEGRARFRGVRTDTQRQNVVRESDGVAVAFEKWLTAFQSARGTDRAQLRRMAQERMPDGL